MIFEETHDLRVTGEAGSGDELLENIRKNDYSIVLLDIAMPGKDVLDTIKDLKFEKPDTPILVFTSNPEEQFAVRLIKAGAAGYINKESDPEDLMEAIRKVAYGGMYISPKLAELLASSIVHGTDKMPHEKLSDREFQVMSMIASGNSVSDIAENLSLSINTVSTHRNHILKKMNMKNNAEITHYAFKYKLV